MKSLTVFAGYVNISVGEINNRQMCERWYSVSSAIVGRSSRDARLETASIRIKARYQSVSILPLNMYQPLVEVSIPSYVVILWFNVAESLAFCEDWGFSRF
jgi:hypothetical protein